VLPVEEEYLTVHEVAALLEAERADGPQLDR
jgi:hypothetical protein